MRPKPTLWLAGLAGGALLGASCIRDEAPNAEADILACTVDADILKRAPIIQNNSVTLLVKPFADLRHQAPEFTLTPGATIEPPGGTERDFTAPQQYEVTSEDGRWRKTYTVAYTMDEISTCFAFEDTLVTGQSRGDYFVLCETRGGWLEWASGNPGFRLTGVAQSAADYPTVQADGGVSGKCVRLTTCSTGSFGEMVGMPLAAGNLFMGTFNVATALTDALKSTQFGFPFHHRPDSLTGYYKFRAGERFLSGGREVAGRRDIFNIYAMFYETDDATPALDGYFKADGYYHPNLVALAVIDDPRETGQWTRFSLPFRYDYGKEVDGAKLAEGRYNVAVVFSSSVDGDVFDGAPGSTLWLDEVELSYDKSEGGK